LQPPLDNLGSFRYAPLVPQPSYDDETLQAYFHPFSDALYDDPVVGPVLRRLAVEDPDIIAAVADVDRSQIRDAMQQTPWERLQFNLRSWNGLMRLRGER
jgi:hypothetical protein